MTQKQFNINSEYYENCTTPRFSFGDPIDSLIGKLDLTEYQCFYVSVAVKENVIK